MSENSCHLNKTRLNKKPFFMSENVYSIQMYLFGQNILFSETFCIFGQGSRGFNHNNQ